MDSLYLKNISIKSSLPPAIKVLLTSSITSLTNPHQSTTLISSPAKSKATWRKSKMPLTLKVRKVCMKNWRMIFSQSWLNPKLKPTRRKKNQKSQSQRQYQKLSSHCLSKCSKRSFPNSCNNSPHQSKETCSPNMTNWTRTFSRKKLQTKCCKRPLMTSSTTCSQKSKPKSARINCSYIMMTSKRLNKTCQSIISPRIFQK